MKKRLVIVLLLSFIIVMSNAASIFAYKDDDITIVSAQKTKVKTPQKDLTSEEKKLIHNEVVEQIKSKEKEGSGNHLNVGKKSFKKQSKIASYSEYEFEEVEPNDEIRYADYYEMNSIMYGYLDLYDVDYYWFEVKYDTQIILDVYSDYYAEYYAALWDDTGEVIDVLQKEIGGSEVYTIDLKPGMYYLSFVEEYYDSYDYPYNFLMYYNYNTRFVDVYVDHWAYNPIENLASKGIINGYDDGTFRPNNKLTRAQAAAMIVNAAGINRQGKVSGFVDVPSTHWASSHIAAAKDAGILNGYGNKFKPNDNVTRAQIAVMISKAFNLKNTGANINFKDVPDSHWANKYVEILASNNIVSGYEGNTFKPNNQTTRAQFAKILSIAMEK